MERGFLSQKESGGGRGVKEKKKGDGGAHDALSGADQMSNKVDNVGMDGDEIFASTPLVDATITIHIASDGVVPPILTPNPGKSSYANVTSNPSRSKVNFHTLFTPTGNGIDVVVPVESIKAISDRFSNTAYGFFLGKRVAYPIVANYVRNTWGWHPDVNLLKEDVGNVPVWVKLRGVPITTYWSHFNRSNSLSLYKD
ncbi:hypothetical protein Tco_0129546 [Tanacetum coccineum]